MAAFFRGGAAGEHLGDASMLVQTDVPSSSPIDTSIVMATCSRAHLLRGALASLAAQDWSATHAVEFVIVDDGSTDETPAVLREFQTALQAPGLGRQAIPVTVLQGTREGLAAARNLGFGAARGAWIASFDDDQLASPGWLRALRERADESQADCVGGALKLLLPEDVRLADLGPRTRRVLGEHLLGARARPYRGGNEHPATNNALVRRDIFVRAGGFDSRFNEGGEDKQFFAKVQACGATLWFEPRAEANHVTPVSRTAKNNLRWTSLRLGASDARLGLTAAGLLATVRLASMRVAVTCLRDAPVLLWARLRRDRRAEVEARCSLWYNEGVLRALPELLSPEHSRQLFLRSLDFRRRNGERTEASQTIVK